MDREIRRLGAALLVLFLALFAQVNYLQVFAADRLANSPGNDRRNLIQEYDVDRGDIRARDDKTLLATSRPTDGDFKYQRTYPNGPLYAGITGFYSIVSGRSGLERAYDEYLAGRADDLLPQRFIDELRGRDLRGGTVVTTIAPRLQRAAQQALGSQRGAVAAIDPRTGEVLVLYSNPSFNPNRLATHDIDAAGAAYEELLPEEIDSVLHPIASDQVFPPGSTFKVVTAAAALENGVQPDDMFPNPTTLDLEQTEETLDNFSRTACLGGVSEISLAQAFQVSCNVTFGHLGQTVLGGERLVEQADRFGFNQDVPSDIRFAEGQLPPESVEKNPPAAAKSAIGQQDVRANPLSMALVVGAVANGGQMMAPQFVREIRDPSGRIVRTIGSERFGEALSQENARRLTALMVAVVASGTGTNAQIPGITVAGKTGTAQTGVEGPPHVWFVGFAPAENPTIAIAVVVLEGGAQGTEATGGVVAAPIAKAVMEAALGAGG